MAYKKRLIEVLCRVQNCGTCLKPSDFDDRYLTYGVRTNEEVADHLVANDVVPVVLCKDCVYWESGKDYSPYCNHPDFGFTFCPKPDDFCSYGERRNNEKDS